MKKLSTLNKSVITAVCIALCIVLPIALHGIPKGGTRTAILLALKNKIPVYNLGNNEVYLKFNNFIHGMKNGKYIIK